jgi:hypothetical protein
MTQMGADEEEGMIATEDREKKARRIPPHPLLVLLVLFVL